MKNSIKNEDGNAASPQENPVLLKKCAACLRLFLLIVTINCLSIVTPAQSLKKQTQFRISAGATLIKTCDFLYSPIVYKSLRTNLQLGYLNTTEKGIFSSDLNLFMGGLQPDSGSPVQVYVKETDIHGTENVALKVLELTQIGFNFETGYLHKLPNMRSARTALYFGCSLEESLTYTPGFINLGVINNVLLNAGTRFDYFLRNGKSLTFSMYVPVISLVTRMPYHQAPGMPDQSGLRTFFTGNNKFETFNHFQKARISFKYNLLVRKHTALDVTYQASWMHYYKPENLTQAGSQLSVGLTF